MPINPYESPQTEPVAPHVRATVPITRAVSITTVLAAGVIGGSLFIVGQGIYLLAQQQGIDWVLINPIFTGFASGIVGSLLVILSADWYIHRGWPAIGSTVLGMLVASPIALFLGILLAFTTHGMQTQRVPGDFVVGLLAVVSFFASLSLGGWMAICLTRRRPSI